MHDEITKDPRTRSALTGLPLADVLDEERCERCGKRGREHGIRTYRVNGKTERLCRSCSDEAAWEEAERSRKAWAEVQAQRAFDAALEPAEPLQDTDTVHYVGKRPR